MGTDNTFVTGVGRLLSGNPMIPFTKDLKGNPLRDKNGNEKVSYSIKLGIPKNSPDCQPLINQIKSVVRQAYPQFHDAAGNPTRELFYKITDGDSQQFDAGGKKICEKPGHAGNYVFKFSTGFAPTCWATGCTQVLTNEKEIQQGYYIRVIGSMSPNNDNLKPGVFLNFNAVELIGYGPIIQSSDGGKATLTSAPVGFIPDGCSSSPVAAPAAPVTPTTPAPAAAPMAPVAPSMPQPSADFLRPPAAPAAPPVEERFNHPQGGTFTREQLRAAKWTDEQINALPRA